MFPAKIYSKGNTVFSNLNSLHKNTASRNRVCSMTTGLFFLERNIGAHLVLCENMYFYCTYSIKTTILSMLGTGYFLKSQKLIPSKKNQYVLIAKISSHKTQKIANPQKFFRCRVDVLHYDFHVVRSALQYSACRIKKSIRNDDSLLL